LEKFQREIRNIKYTNMENSRRKFLTSISMLAAYTAFPINAFSFGNAKKLRIVLVGTGIRGTSFWGKTE